MRQGAGSLTDTKRKFNLKESQVSTSNILRYIMIKGDKVNTRIK
jgi:hypothetical protein